MENCKYCKKNTKNVELLPNGKMELIVTNICKKCYNKLICASKI